MTVFGLSIWWAVMLFGKERAGEAYRCSGRKLEYAESRDCEEK
jgi:hypothetical protein